MAVQAGPWSRSSASAALAALGEAVLRVPSQDTAAVVHSTDLFLSFLLLIFKNVYSFVVVVVLMVDFDIRARQEYSKQKAELAFYF